MKLVVIEGIDASGKTTLATKLAESLSPRFRVLLTQEPFTDDIKQLLEKYKWNDQVLLALLFSADRRIHVKWMESQNVDLIISDRYFFSTLAYQGVGANQEWLESLSSIFPLPSLTILLDVPVSVALERLRSKRDSLDFEEKRRSLDRVRENYLSLSKRYNFKVLDGTLPLEKLLSISLEFVRDLLSSSTSPRSPDT